MLPRLVLGDGVQHALPVDAVRAHRERPQGLALIVKALAAPEQRGLGDRQGAVADPSADDAARLFGASDHAVALLFDALGRRLEGERKHQTRLARERGWGGVEDADHGGHSGLLWCLLGRFRDRERRPQVRLVVERTPRGKAVGNEQPLLGPPLKRANASLDAGPKGFGGELHGRPRPADALCRAMTPSVAL